MGGGDNPKEVEEVDEADAAPEPDSDCEDTKRVRKALRGVVSHQVFAKGEQFCMLLNRAAKLRSEIERMHAEDKEMEERIEQYLKSTVEALSGCQLPDPVLRSRSGSISSNLGSQLGA